MPGLLLLGGCRADPIDPPISPAQPVAACTLQGEAETRHVKTVTDGDTLRLSDGRSVRIVGINTPEMGYDGAADEPLARQGKVALERLMAQNAYQLQIQSAAQARDRHGRTLAYLFDRHGNLIAADLLAKGLGWAVIVAPNRAYRPCLEAAENRARAAKVGVWALPEYDVRPAKSLRAGEGGFRRIRGRVNSVRRAGGAIWVELDKRVSLRLPTDPESMQPVEVMSLKGRTVTARGWVSYRKSDRYPPFTLRISDSLMIERIE